ncbi:MAG: hypothetical protein IMX00_02060 [Limnochordales bacterium]|nr:hypothetical protein [Limnochordales bacterium]
MKDLAVRPAPLNGRIMRRIRLKPLFAIFLAAAVLLLPSRVAGSTLEDRLKAVGPGVHLRTIVWQDEEVPSTVHRVQLLIVDRSYLAPSGPLVISTAPAATSMPLVIPISGTEVKSATAGGAPAGSVASTPITPPGSLPGIKSAPSSGAVAATGGLTSSPAQLAATASQAPGTTFTQDVPVLLGGLEEELPDTLSAYPNLAGIRISNGELLYASSGVPAMGILLNGQPVSGLPLLWAKAEPLRPSGIPYISVAVDQVNLPHTSGVTYYTPAFGKTTGTEPGTTEFVLAGKDGKALARPGPDTRIEAVVVSVRRSGNSSIPADGAVLAVSGPEASRLTGYLTNGQTVRLTFQLIPTQWRTAREVVPGEHLLLTGRVMRPLPEETPAVSTPSAHVAFAYNEKVLMFLAVDDTTSVNGPEWAGAPAGLWRAEGLTLPELARLLQELGMADAISLPARFTLRIAGEASGTSGAPGISGVSSGQGASGSASTLPRTVGIWNTAPSGPLFLLQIEGASERVLVGSRVALQAIGLDTGFHPVSLSPASLSWSVLTNNAILEKQGAVTYLVPQAPGRVAVRAEVLAAEGTPVQKSWEGEAVAASRLRRITLAPTTALLAPGESLTFTVTGWDESGRPVYIDPALLVWDVPTSLGYLDTATGTLLPSARALAATSSPGSGPATGVIRVSLRARPDLSATAYVGQGPGPRPVTDLSAPSPQWVMADPKSGYLRVVAAPSPRPTTVGPLMLQPVFRTGSSARELVVRPHPGLAEMLTLTTEERAVGLWLYTSVDQAVVLVAEWADATGRTLSSSFAPFSIDGTAQKTPVLQLTRGWHFLLASVPATATTPAALTGIRLLPGQTDSAALAGELPALGALLAISTTSSAAGTGTPAVQSTSSAAGAAATAAQSLVTFREVQPADGRAILTPTPRFSARLEIARGWELDTASLRFLLDGKVVWSREQANSAWGRLIYGEGGFERESGRFWFMPAQPLPAGSHRARLEFTLIGAGSGGEPTTERSLAKFEWQFTVAPQAAPAVSHTRPLRIAVVGGPALAEVPDEAGERIFREIIRRLNNRLAQPDAVDLVVVVGDMTAANSEPLHARAAQLLQNLKIPYLVIPGKRDLDAGGSTSREQFLKTWGLTCGRLDIGTTRLLLLDTVDGIGGHDPTQWDWFARELASSPASKITRYVIFSYRSPLAPAPGGSEAGWPEAGEAEKLLSLLSTTETGGASAPEILFVSGSPAAFLAQQDRGVLYLTSGGGGRQPEAPPDAGGFYHWLELTLPADGPVRWAVVPLVQTITVGGLPDKLRVNGSVTPWAIADLYTASRSPLRITIQPPLAYKWSVSDPRLATINPSTGELTAKAPGKVQVTLEVGGVSISKQLEILPPVPLPRPTTSTSG